MSVQSLERGLSLLRVLSTAGSSGKRLVELHRQLGLSKSTVHRLLVSLVNHSFVEQVSDTRRYRLGNEIALLGWSAAQALAELKEVCEKSVVDLANETGDTAFLFVRSGLETICLDRRSGSYPVKAFTVDVGVRRPLGVGASGIAFLALMNEHELYSTLDRLRDSLRRWPSEEGALIQAVTDASRNGYAISDGFTVPGVRGLAKVVRNSGGDAVAALGIAAVSSRISNDRLPRLLEKLDACIEEVEETLSLQTGRGLRR
ncbi:IclR family transcriptional regulator [Microvirga zambiensis]|uniref:IclR family transcriptional regulator n=1 Tax=Microvirga zambiensis TaxID=1402137 RepID=UPI00191CA89C|nr:IclR family transcriptional regulator [Microvirga zambiensis]